MHRNLKFLHMTNIFSTDILVGLVTNIRYGYLPPLRPCPDPPRPPVHPFSSKASHSHIFTIIDIIKLSHHVVPFSSPKFIIIVMFLSSWFHIFIHHQYHHYPVLNMNKKTPSNPFYLSSSASLLPSCSPASTIYISYLLLTQPRLSCLSCLRSPPFILLNRFRLSFDPSPFILFILPSFAPVYLLEPFPTKI